MSFEAVPFRLELSGDTADAHEFQGYDGYMALAGFAWTLALVSNYAETGKIRQRGEFPGRNSVRASALRPGSIVADFSVWLATNPAQIINLGAGVAGVSGSAILFDLVKRVIARNLGQEDKPDTDFVKRLLEVRGGDVEALVARTEPAIRQAHAVIGNGAEKILVVGGYNIINTFDKRSRDYVKLNFEDDSVRTDSFSVAAFNVNSGYGSVFDRELGRTVPISMSRDVLRQASSTFTWALDQYANKTGGAIAITYTRILAMDETPKRYVVLSAKRILNE